MNKYAGAEWVKESLGLPMSPLGEKVADLLGQACRGIYHLDAVHSLEKVRWTDKYCIEVNVRDNMSTWDGCLLTDLVVLAHEACLRLEIRARTVNVLRLYFSQRKGRIGSSMKCHPTIEMAVERVRANLMINSLTCAPKED